MRRMYSLEEVATGHRLDEHMKDPVRWLADQIRAKRISATKFGRCWLMDDAQIEAMLAVLGNLAPTESAELAEPAQELRPRGLSAASMRRRII